MTPEQLKAYAGRISVEQKIPVSNPAFFDIIGDMITESTESIHKLAYELHHKEVFAQDVDREMQLTIGYQQNLIQLALWYAKEYPHHNTTILKSNVIRQ